MKDIKRLIIYGGGSFAVIIALIALSRMETLPSGVVVFAAVMFVVVLPVVYAINVSKKERKNAGKNL